VSTHYIFNLREEKLPSRIGSKARNLKFLLEKGFKIPETYVCTWDAYHYYLLNSSQVHDSIKDQLSKSINPNRYYAVRSSANSEDGQNHSFAGQFKSILNVQGIDSIVSAIETIWLSTCSPGVTSYLERIGIDPSTLKMAVLIQEMVSPLISGVSFSKNPLTGMDEIIVEATKGNGENLLQNGFTPERWVNKWGEWIAQPDHGNIDLTLIQEVVTQTNRIAHAYERNIDVEWVYDGTTINWVQLREITSLKDTTFYSHHFAREVFPGVIKPLVWSVNVPLVCGAWVRFFTELIGKNDIDPQSLAKSFYHHAYFNMGTIGKIFEALGFPPNTIELLIGIESNGAEKPSFKPTKKTLSLLPRMVRCAFDKLMFSKKIKSFIPVMSEHYHSFSTTKVAQLPEEEILTTIEKLYALNEETAYFTINTYLLMGLYNGILKSQLRKVGVDFEHFDLTKDMKELKQFDPTVSLAKLSHAYNQLDEQQREIIKKCTYREFLTLEGIETLQREAELFITHFGHLSDSGNDFSSVPWRENPDLVLTMMANYIAPMDKSLIKSDFAHLKVSAPRRVLLHLICRLARTYRLYREKVSSLYTYGYGLFRIYFLALGHHFVKRGIMVQPEDIFYLSLDEVKDTVSTGCVNTTYKDTILLRKQEMEEYRTITPPQIIYGDQPPPITSHAGHTLRGIPTSKGFYKGRVRVIKSIQEFHKLKKGEVLVIPYSDVGWTPLFTRAGAIIAESGGFLSHSSIIAREYGIPAIVSVPDACQLKDGTLVTVDGFQGEITMLSSSQRRRGSRHESKEKNQLPYQNIAESNINHREESTEPLTHSNS